MLAHRIERLAFFGLWLDGLGRVGSCYRHAAVECFRRAVVVAHRAVDGFATSWSNGAGVDFVVRVTPCALRHFNPSGWRA